MKAIFAFLAFCTISLAQVPQGAAAPPAAAPTLPNLPDEEVLATFPDGVKFTMGEFRKVFAVLPPDSQQMALRDPKMFFHRWGLMRSLTQMAEKSKLEEQSPYKEALNLNRIQILSQAQVSEVVKNSTVEPAELVKYYDVNKAKYKSVRVKAIYVSFNNNPAALATGGKKPLTEEQANAKAAKLLAELRAGADFVKLVKEHSDDEPSRSKDGEFPTLRQTDNIPDAIKTPVFALKQGELTEVVRQPNGFYIFRAEEIIVRPFSQVREEIYNLLKDQHTNEWMAKTDREFKMTYNSTEFFAPKK